MPRPPLLPVVDWKAVFDSGYDYPTWLRSGESPENQARMEALRAGLVLEPAVQAMLREGMSRRVNVVAIAEDWCGDVVRHVPALQRMADVSSNLHVRYIPREKRLDVFARFLTNGGEAIPKFVFLSDQWVECGNWGPMPAQCRELIARGKACGDVAAARRKVAALYEADADLRTVVEELAHCVAIAGSIAP